MPWVASTDYDGPTLVRAKQQKCLYDGDPHCAHRNRKGEHTAYLEIPWLGDDGKSVSDVRRALGVTEPVGFVKAPVSKI